MSDVSAGAPIVETLRGMLIRCSGISTQINHLVNATRNARDEGYDLPTHRHFATWFVACTPQAPTTLRKSTNFLLVLSSQGASGHKQDNTRNPPCRFLRFCVSSECGFT
jgi:hypothetical protein